MGVVQQPVDRGRGSLGVAERDAGQRLAAVCPT
jgi:hypothetical protein